MNFYEFVGSIIGLIGLIGFGVFALVWLCRYDLKVRKQRFEAKEKEREFFKTHYDLIEARLSSINDKL